MRKLFFEGNRPCRCCFVILMFLGIALDHPAWARALTAGPEDYAARVRVLQAGDTLVLRAGNYAGTLRLHNLNGTEQRPITVEGAQNGKTVLFAKKGHNTVSILNSSHLILKNISINGLGLGMDGVKAEGHSDYAHHITLENLHIFNLGGDQQTVGISTKCPAWNWVVRGNRIENAGTGMYFGSSDGNVAFVAGLIEYNQVLDSVGYNLQIKHLIAHPDELKDFPVDRTQTVIRYNVFSKPSERTSHYGVRPNVLIGHAPLTGSGIDDWVLVYGNLFFQNPDEALFQGEGNIALYNNVFVNAHAMDQPAVVIQPHNCVPRKIRVFFNTILADGPGIVVWGGSALYKQYVWDNAVFAMPAVRASQRRGNMTASYEQAANFVRQPVLRDGCVDLALLPQSGGTEFFDVTNEVEAFENANLDFFGRARQTNVPGAIIPNSNRSTLICKPAATAGFEKTWRSERGRQ